ncbi:MAG: hypothetical protein ACTHJX_02240 [Terriglobales bacterium]
MKWPWQAAAEVKRQRDHALVRAVQLEARLRDVSEDRERVAAERRQAEEALARVVDNALFAAGAAPVFHPEDARFQPRPAEQQAADARRAQQPLSPAEWRRKVELLDAERMERDRKARLHEELQRMASERRSLS